MASTLYGRKGFRRPPRNYAQLDLSPADPQSPERERRMKKMDYQAAWETAMAEWAFPSNEDRPRQPIVRNLEPRRKKHPPVTSG